MGMMLNFGLGLPMVLGVGSWVGFGFWICPLVTVVVEYFMLFVVWFVFVHKQRLHEACWPDEGWSWANVSCDRVTTFLKMYAPAALTISSDFWRMAAVGAIAAVLSSDDLGVFNASYRIFWMSLTFTGAMASAMGTKLGIALGSGDPIGARRVVTIGMGMAFTSLIVLTGVVFIFPRQLATIFTSDQVLLDKFEGARASLAITMFMMNAANVLEKVPMTMGRTKEILYIGLVGSWGGQVPIALLCVKYWRRDLTGVYTGVAFGYGILCCMFIVLISRTDWEQQAKDAQARSETKSEDGDDEEANKLADDPELAIAGDDTDDTKATSIGLKPQGSYNVLEQEASPRPSKVERSTLA